MCVVDGGTTSGDMASTCDTPPLVQCVGVLCIQKHFCASCYVIFDGYSDGPSSKCMEQERRAMKVQSSDIQLLDDMTVTVRQERHCKEQYCHQPSMP